jgi:ATP-dependent helicase/nuclease subunit A
VTATTNLRNTYAAPTTASGAPADDEPARKRILTDLDTNMLVEAGAGSGKTTSLVGRMHALIVRGEPVERIAAVTFTRKAASELRERFQLRLEAELRLTNPDTDAWQRCDRALRDLDRAFLGTIHSFCARILREHPLGVALDPNFAEVSEDDWEQLTRGYWRRWLEQCNRRRDAALPELKALGVDPRSLYDGFKAVMMYQDVDFPLPDTPSPDGAPCRAKLEMLISHARAMMPTEDPFGGPDNLMTLLRTLEYARASTDWNRIDAFCAALERVTKTACTVVQKRWSDTTDGRAEAKLLAEDFLALLEGDITALLTCWREHRYPAVMRFLKRAAAEFSDERHRTGQLGFEDLLMFCARLLRERPLVRDALGERYRHLLVDEFQDTDPIQAEVCFLLASKSSTGRDWRSVTPRPGGIFLVGDPKQSIYRFRRADIQVYEFAKARMQQCGAVLSLTRNFRSVAPIGDFVNAFFKDAFPDAATDIQAAFTPMQTVRGAEQSDGVSQYWVRPEKNNNSAIVATDAAQVASWIAARVSSGECSAGDFLILSGRRSPLAAYARALGERNIAVSTTGARLPQEAELKELLVLLRAIADPDNPILVAAALEGLFFGCSPADLYDARIAGLHFSITHPPDACDVMAVAGLLRLHEWWKLSQRQPADVLVEHILDDTGLLYFAASQPLGDARAGALLRLVEVLRAASTSGASGITDAMDRITDLLVRDSDDAPLRAGRLDAVRVMNLHKAKGLEAKVVILAAPITASEYPPSVHVVRADSGAASGGILIAAGHITVAQPVGWAEMVDMETSFAKAERQRLLYVAATRAGDELVIARCERPQSKSKKEPTPDTSAWSPFGDVLNEMDRTIVMVASASPGRRSVEHSAKYIAETIAAARSRVESASTVSSVRRTVTGSAEAQQEASHKYSSDPGQGRGVAWGRAVHRCIEAAGHGRTGVSLSAFVAAVASEEKLTIDQAGELERLIEEVLRSEPWSTLTAGGQTCFELPVMQFARDATSDATTPTLTEGIIDAATLTDGEWSLVDWKTDVVEDSEWKGRLVRYQRQVGAYEQILGTLSGRPTQSVIQRVRTAKPDGLTR